jgi:alanyl-tRNA synthetase
MTGNEIRKRFLEYFAGKGHTVVESSSLVPQDDPTLLFTNAGMVQFKRVFMGEDKRDYRRAATCQRCVRAGGKHNDLENVGYTARHHTFFEMLGNFSFGDYFKEEAIAYAWDFLTRVIGLPAEKLWVSVFEEDDEAFALWEKVEELPRGRILRLGAAENFWAMGDTGPCGPCSEIHYDQGEKAGCGRPDCQVGCDCDRFLEVWNLVFMQFYRDETGTMTPLPKPSIDTGMGLERIASVIQGKLNNYDSDLFQGIIARIAEVSGKPYGESSSINTAMRVIADHSRATAFLVADGVLPSNEGRGYVLRRIMRRAIRFGRTLGLRKPFMSAVTGKVVETMKDAYPHLLDTSDLLEKVVRHEEERFFETLDHGLAMLGDEIRRLGGVGETRISGEFIFRLYDTFGFPIDIVKDIALEQGLTADEAGFNAAMDLQREQSKRSWKGTSLGPAGDGVKQLRERFEKSAFLGYEKKSHASRLAALLDESGALVQKVRAGDQASVFCPETTFYAEAGGQAGDHGEITGEQGRARVINTVSAGDGYTLHLIEVLDGSLTTGEPVQLKVSEGRRQLVANNHTATHLLQAALREILGEHVRQSGSLVDPDRLRFDFTHFSPLTLKEIGAIEQLVNERIRANTKVHTDILAREEAVRSGATALFGEKYEESVRVVSVGDFSKELCGGTHVGATGEIGLFKMISETGIAAGVRRIEAITGPAAFSRFQQAESNLLFLAEQLKTTPDELAGKLEKFLTRQKELEKEIGRLTAQLAVTDLDSIIANAVEVDGVRVVAREIPMDSPKTMREVGDKVRDRLGSGIVVLGGVYQGKVSLLALVSKDLAGRFHAGEIIKEIAAMVGGGGGGRPDMAQAGGTMPDKLKPALNAVTEAIKKQAARK